MGEVWSATDRTTGAPVAVKLAQLWAISEPELVARFEQEGKLLKRLRSPYHLRATSTRADQGRRALTSSSNDSTGETLEALLEREGYLSLEEAGRIADEMLAGAHRRARRRASFIAISARGTSSSIASATAASSRSSSTSASRRRPRRAPAHRAPASQVTMGSLRFIAPEQLGDAAKAGPRADLYAIGTILFRALTGKMPFGDATATQLVVAQARARSADQSTRRPERSGRPALRTFLTKTIARTPGKRYASAEIALAALREAMRGRAPPLEMPEGPIESTADARCHARRKPRSR